MAKGEGKEINIYSVWDTVPVNAGERVTNKIVGIRRLDNVINTSICLT